MKRLTILCVCGDSGGASAMAPVLAELIQAQRVEIRAFAYAYAPQVWSRAKIRFGVLNEMANLTALCDAVGLDQADLLLVGTSVNAQNYERHLTESAQIRKIPSLALLDFWTNYRERFDDETGALRYLPDLIAVMDERARAEMTALGFDGARMVITGQPAFDALHAERALFNEARRQEIRTGLGITTNERLAVFLSQPLTAMPGTMGLDEKQIVSRVLQALESFATTEHIALSLLFRPHPREETGWVDQLSNNTIRLIVSNQDDAHELVQAADLVIGINSVLLVEACYLGCIVTSVQIGLRGKDVLPTNAAGYSRAVYDERELVAVLRTMLLDQRARSEMRARLESLQVEPAAVRVAQHSYQMLGLRG